MAGLTKEQRAQRAAEKLAAELGGQNNPEPQDNLVTMVTDFESFPGAPTEADVHPDEVENWKAHGWRLGE
ncbi:hypothetical protein K3G69_21785 [Phytobacter diazotrophicus]|uniref:hypothetical protein n=1 Tax=Phytobacter diazotrophicus TaxID=395631 RepID=UPI001C99531D|nr:hypothetical protein [Phytobacter diazotrophicus]MBY6259129.1 hypothetical protein [Phytobacter diazotrophicus]